MKKTAGVLLSIAVLLLELLSPALSAQEGQPEELPENTAPASGEPVKEKGDSDGMKLPEVVVREEQEQEDDGYAVDDASTATKTDTPIIDIPQSIQVVPHQVIEDQRATSLTEILRNVSGFSPSVNSQSQRFGDRDIIFRGFVTNNYFTNGYKNAFNGSSFSFGIANIDRVEVLKGPSSVLYGLGEPSGTVNVITKQPLPFWYANGTLIGGNYGYISPSIDVSGPITPGKQLLFRFNTAYQHQDSFVDFVDSDTFQIAPVLTWIIGPDTVITFEGEYQALSDLYYTGLPAQGTIQANINGKIPRSRYLGDKKLEGENFPERTQGIIGYRFEHIFNEHVTLKNGFFATIFDTDERDVIPEFLDVDERTMFRSLFEGTTSREDYYISTDLIFRFNTGPVGHQLLAGSDQRFNYTDSRSATAEIEPIDVFDPVYGNVVNPIGPDTPRRLLSTSGTFIGFYLQDLVTITEQVRVLLGLRYDIAEQDSKLRFTDDPSVVRDKFDDDVFSPLAGVVYQPVSFLALYANYTESFNPVSGTSRTGKQFKPESGIQFEGGAKFEFFEGRLFSTMAVYQITKENILTPDPVDELFSVQIGEQRSRGFEFDISGQVLPGLSLIASYAYTDARITKSNPEFGIEIQGNRPANVPKHSGTAWTVYDFYKGYLTGLSLGAGVIAVGKREADIFDSGMLPAYARVDALVGYKVNKYIDLAVNIKNLFDTKYFETSTFGVWENGISPGAPFTIFGTLSVSYN